MISKETQPKTILVTGASGGIGLAVVKHLIKNTNYQIYFLVNKDKEILQNHLQNLDYNYNSKIFNADLTCEQEVENIRDQIETQSGALWGLINLAGISSNAMSWKIKTEEFKRVLDTNVLSTFLTYKAFVPSMRKQNEGRIINISSVLAIKGAIGAAHYAASKAAIIGFTKSISLELAEKNITANVIAPGYMDSGLIKAIPEEALDLIKQQIPMNRLGDSAEIGNAISFLLDTKSSYMTGQVMNINGGLY